MLVGQGFPIRQMQQLARLARKKRQLPGQRPGLLRVRGQHGQKRVLARQFGDTQRGAAARKRSAGGARTGLAGPRARGEQGGEAHSGQKLGVKNCGFNSAGVQGRAADGGVL